MWWVAVVAAVVYAGVCVVVPAVILVEGGPRVLSSFPASLALRLLIRLGDWRGGPQ